MPATTPLTEAEHEQQRANVRSSVSANSAFDQDYAVMNVLATVVACYGLLADSAAVVIGAMIIAMLLGPISGVGLALVDGDSALLRKAGLSLGGGMLLVMVTALVIGFCHSEIPANQQMVARTAPNLFGLMIALGGGAAGAWATISPRLSVAFVGVAIATALVPPLATCSIFLARGNMPLAGGAFLLAVANIVAIQFAASAVFYLKGFRNFTRGARLSRGVLVGDIVSVVVLLVLAVVLTASLHGLVSQELYKSAVRRQLQADIAHVPGAALDDVRFISADNASLALAVVRSPVPFTAAEVATMQSGLPPDVAGGASAIARAVRAHRRHVGAGPAVRSRQWTQHDAVIFAQGTKPPGQPQIRVDIVGACAT